MNDCKFIGYLTRDPEIRSVNGPNGETKVVSFGLAVPTRRTGNSSFPSCEAWGIDAERIYEKFKKKDLIVVHAEHVTDSWDDKNTGQKRYKDKFRVNRWEFVPYNSPKDKVSEESEEDVVEKEEDEKPVAPKKAPRARPLAAPVEEEDSDEDSIPF